MNRHGAEVGRGEMNVAREFAAERNLCEARAASANMQPSGGLSLAEIEETLAHHLACITSLAVLANRACENAMGPLPAAMTASLNPAFPSGDDRFSRLSALLIAAESQRCLLETSVNRLAEFV